MRNVRMLRTFDFLPDFECRGVGRTLHTAALAGRRWIFVAFPATARAFHAQVGPPHVDNPMEREIDVMYAVVGESTNETKTAEYSVGYVVSDTRIARLLFGDQEDGGVAACLLIDRDQKILRRYDCNVSDVPSTVKEAIRVSQEVVEGTEAEIIPVLRVSKALAADVCGRLVEYHLQSAQKVQGRVGLSNSSLDLSLKRVVHVNADPELGKAIDEHLVFSLLPAVERVFDYRVTHRVAYKISAYSAQASGFFAAHRDNSDPGTLFRRFALSLSLNDDWNGGGICFPEYSNRSYKLATGDALIFPASLLHRVEPIRDGDRFVLLSFLYDKQGSQVRRSAMKNPEVLEGEYRDSISSDLLVAYEQYAPLSRFSPQYALTAENKIPMVG